jgi:hypothetical protein
MDTVEVSNKYKYKVDHPLTEVLGIRSISDLGF